MFCLWIPRWLGEIYSQLFLDFETNHFTFTQAKNSLNIDSGKLNVAFSRLHSERILTVFERSKPRVYRLIDPSSLVLLTSETVKNVEAISQERYLHLIIDSFRVVSKIFNIRSFAIYGSVARGRAQDISDLDILIISNDFKGSFGKRIEQLFRVDEAVQKEIEWLRKQDIFTRLSFFPLKPSEAETLPKLFLDLTEDAIILYDKRSFLEQLLLELKAKLLKKGAIRVFLDKDHWYWDLKPDYKFGETIEIP